MNAFQRLQKRSFGGEDVATRPGAEDDAWWPKGPLLPGIPEVLDSFEAAVNSGEGLSLVFLLGGAGNGKSFAARELSHRFDHLTEPGDPLARRLYRTIRGRTTVALLNDATIASAEEYGNLQAVALGTDFSRWVTHSEKSPVAAFCCVNRGVVIDELRAMQDRREGLGAFAKALLSWLASPQVSMAAQLYAEREAPPSFAPRGLSTAYYRQEAFSLGGLKVWVSALSVDAFSLMEPTDGTASRAGLLFRQILQRCRHDAESRPEKCPVRANVAQWMDDAMCSRWEEVMASAEIGSGRPHSYREIWGLSSLSIIGPRFADGRRFADTLSHIDRCLDRAELASTPAGRLTPLLGISRFRAHEALFRSAVPVGNAFQPQYPPATPAHPGLSLIDPSAWGSADSSVVEGAMQVIAIGGRPSEQLAHDGLLPASWSPFDDALEKSLVAYVDDSTCPDAARRRLISWYGGYLVRLVGVSTGRLGNAAVIEAWRQCYRLCANQPAPLPRFLEAAIRALLFPSHEAGTPNTILIPAFAVRVEPLRSTRDGMTAKLAEVIQHTPIALRVARAGSRLTLECLIAGSSTVVGQLALDFALVREALSCRGGRAGQTESTAFIDPRIERCRAAALEAMPDEYRRLVAISGGKQVELTA